jgi:epoxide hydrolase-like predicted phosphatase
MAIRAVFFDFGGVIMRTEYQSPRQTLAERFNMDYDEIDRAVFGSDSARRASLGEITEDTHWAAVSKRFKQPASEMQVFRNQFFGGDVIDHKLVEYIRSLHEKVHTGLISNAWSGLREFITKQNLISLFDTVVISAEVGVVKPSARIYEVALERSRVSANEAVFIDDMPVNVEACEKVGMKGILFTDTEKTISILDQLVKSK